MANAQYYVVPLSVTLSSGGVGTVTLSVGSNQTVEIHRIQQKSTGPFDITKLTDSFGNNLGTVTPNNPLDGNYFSDIETDNNVNSDLIEPITIQTNGELQISVKDTSASANVVVFYLTARRIEG